MTIRLTIVGDPDLNDPLLDLVASRIRDNTTTNFVRRCKTVDGDCGLLAQIATVCATDHKNKIDILDIFDHGRRGRMRLGNGILFEADCVPGKPLIKGEQIATAMAKCLTDTAHVRLLGCSTAHKRTGEHREGRWLLLRLAELLGGHRVVFGTLASINEDHFGDEGFLKASELALLFS